MNKFKQHNNVERLGGHNILNYLSNSLPHDEIRKFEDALTEDEMLGDALEGLSQLNIKDAKEINIDLNNYINKKIVKSNNRNKNNLGFPYWIVMTIIILFLLIAVGFFIVHKLAS
jgi:hypothetical protein